MKLSVPLEKRVSITVPGEEPFDCTFVQPRQIDMHRRQDLNIRMDPYNFIKARAYDVFFVLRECDITDEGDQQLWHPTRLKNRSMAITEFMQGWEKLTPELAEALWEAALEVSPAWDWRATKENEKSFREWASPSQE